jgi:RNA recognition motif-containing protein
MSKRLYVGNLPYSVTDQTLMDLFSSVGTVEEAKVIVDGYSRRSKGFGFVQFADDAEADKAIETYNGYEIEGRALVVNEARQDTPRENRSGGGGGYGGGDRGGFRGGYSRDR